MAVIGNRVTRCEIKGLDTTEATVRAHWHHIIDGGVEIGSPWSRTASMVVPRSNAVLSGIVAAVRGWVLVDEQVGWVHFPQIASISIRMVDFVRYASEYPGDWGMAAFYHRLGADGFVIDGFDGSILYRLQNGVLLAHGFSPDAARAAQFAAYEQRLFGYVEKLVDQRILGV